MTENATPRDHFGQDINVDDRVLIILSLNQYAWGKVDKLTAQKAKISYETKNYRGDYRRSVTYKFFRDVVVIGNDMKQTIAIDKLTS